MVGQAIEAGSVFYEFRLKNEVPEEAAKADAAMQQMGVQADASQHKFDTMTLASGKTARGLREMGMSAAMLGAAVGEAGPQFAGISATLMEVGTVTMMVGPWIRSLGFAHREVIPMVEEFIDKMRGKTAVTIASAAADVVETGATEVDAAAQKEASVSYFEMTEAEWDKVVAQEAATAATVEETLATGALRDAMLVLAGASVIGLVLVGLYELYQITNADKAAAEEYKKETDALSRSISVMQQVVAADSVELKAATSAYEAQKNVVTNLQNADKTLLEEEKAISEVIKDELHYTNQLTDARDGLKGATLGIKEAQQAVRDAEESGDPLRIERAKLQLEMAKHHKADAAQRVTDLEAEHANIEKTGAALAAKYGTTDAASTLKAIEDQRVATEDKLADAIDTQNKLYETQMKIQKDVDAAEKKAKEAEFMKQLIEWQQQGVKLTKEQLDTFMGVDYMASALQKVPVTETRRPDLMGIGTITGREIWNVLTGQEPTAGMDRFELFGGTRMNQLFAQSGLPGQTSLMPALTGYSPPPAAPAPGAGAGLSPLQVVIQAKNMTITYDSNGNVRQDLGARHGGTYT
jgi:hypothetical protein